MIIIRKIFARSAFPFVQPLQIKTLNFLSTDLTISKIRQIHSKLLTESRKLKPDQAIKMLHFVHFKSQKKSQNSILTPIEIESIVSNLSSQVNNFRHEDIFLLLQTISEFPKYSRYNRNNPFMRLVMKKLNMVQVMTLNPKFIFELLSILEKMEFPNIIISKYVNSIVNRQEMSGMTMLNVLRFFICIMEMKFIHPELLSRFYNKEIRGKNISDPKDMAYLYYICKSIDRSLKAKIVYFQNKNRLNELVYNPYNEPETNRKADKDQKLAVDLQKQKLQEVSQKLAIEIKNRIDLKKLKSDISKKYVFERHPLDMVTAVILSDITQLNSVLFEVFQKNYKSMGPFQFVALLPSAPQKQQAKYYKDYSNRVWKHLPLKQKLELLNNKPRFLKAPIEKQDLLKAISESTSISNEEFSFVNLISVMNLDEDGQLEIIRAVGRLVGSPQGE